MYEYPPILSGTALQQIAALRDYLVRRAREEDEDPGAPTALAPAAAAGGAALAVPTAAAPAAGDAALRSLIVKTADTVRRQVDLLTLSLHEDYLAKSEFGSYQEQIDTAIRATAREIVEGFDFTARLEAADERLGDLTAALSGLRGQIRRGLIRDPETGELAFGIAVAEELRFTGETVTEDGLDYAVLSPGQTLGLYTASGWQFWCGGAKRGWFDASDGQLHVSGLRAEQELRLGGDWVMTASGGFGLRYVGAVTP